MIFHSTSKSKKKESYLAIDIGTENIKTVLFRIEDKEVKVIGYNKMTQDPLAMNKSVIIDFEKVITTLDKSIGNVIKSAKEQFDDVLLPEKVMMGVAGELISGAPIIVNVERDDPNEKITQKEIDSILEKVKEHTFESTKLEIAKEIGLKSEQVVEIDTSIDSISVDGALIKDPVGISGNEITYRVFSSFGPRYQVDSIHKIAKQIKLNLQKIIVEPYALANNLHGITDDQHGAIIIDIGAGTTDVIITRDNQFLGMKMFAIGGRVFTKRLMNNLDLSYEEAEEMKSKYSKGDLTKVDERNVKDAIKSEVESWLLGVELALSEIEDVDEYPSQIYICGGGAFLPEIHEGLMEYPWIQSLNFKKHPKINLLLPNKISDLKDLTRSANEIQDVTPLSMARMFLNELITNE